MSTQGIAAKLVQFCREGKNMDAINELYSDDIVSSEKEWKKELVKGKEAVIAKNNEWYASVEEFHGSEISDAIVAGDFFACTMKYDVTFKGQGRTNMEEIALYEVKDDKIVSEQFFYAM